jgi:hypothetical protein
MGFSQRELVTIVHGMLFGGLYLLPFAAVYAELRTLRQSDMPVDATIKSVNRVALLLWVMTGAAWLACFSGTFLVYPWYRTAPPPGVVDFSPYPRSLLLSQPDLAAWHRYGMEWKEHAAWLVPILTTAAAWMVSRHKRWVIDDLRTNKLVTGLVVISFMLVVLSATIGALLNKIAPVR